MPASSTRPQPDRRRFFQRTGRGWRARGARDPNRRRVSAIPHPPAPAAVRATWAGRRPARRVPRIGDVVAIDMERLVLLQPDVVVAWPDGGNAAQRAGIARLAIPGYDQQVGRLSDLAPAVRRLGVLAGTERQGAARATALDARLAARR